MRKKRILMLIGSVCLALMLLVPLAVSCGPATPEAEEIAELEAKLTAEKTKVKGLEGDVSDLEDEIAALRKPAEVFTLKLQSWASRGEFYYEEIQPHLINEVKAMSDSRLILAPYGLGEIAEPADMLEATGRMTLDLIISPGYHEGVEPVGGVEYGLPMGLRDPLQVMTMWYDRGLLDYLRNEVYLAHNVWLLGPNVEGPVPMTSKKEIKSLADLEGLKVRAYGGPADTLAALGVSVIWVPYAEVYTALATGVIDGACAGSASEQFDLGLHEVGGYMLVWPAVLPTQCSSVFINLDTWNALPDDLQSILTVAVRDFAITTARIRWLGDATVLEQMADMGITLVRFSPDEAAEMTTKALAVWDKTAQIDAHTAEAIRMIKEYLQFLGVM